MAFLCIVSLMEHLFTIGRSLSARSSRGRRRRADARKPLGFLSITSALVCANLLWLASFIPFADVCFEWTRWPTHWRIILLESNAEWMRLWQVDEHYINRISGRIITYIVQVECTYVNSNSFVWEWRVAGSVQQTVRTAFANRSSFVNTGSAIN